MNVHPVTFMTTNVQDSHVYHANHHCSTCGRWSRTVLLEFVTANRGRAGSEHLFARATARQVQAPAVWRRGAVLFASCRNAHQVHAANAWLAGAAIAARH